jgi:hypothetical protein
VIVIGRPHDYRLDALFLLKHNAEVAVLFRLGVLLERVGGVIPINIAQRHDVLAADIMQIAAALAADADAGNIEFLAGRRLPRPPEHVPRHDRERHYSGTRTKQSPTGHGCLMDLRVLPSSLHRPTFPKSQSSITGDQFSSLEYRGARRPSTTFREARPNRSRMNSRL